MRDVVAHVVFIAVLVWIGRSLHWPWWGIAAVMAAGFMVLQAIFARGRRAPGHLGAASIANDDPLMVAALEQARRTWSIFQRLHAEHPDTTVVKFRLRTNGGDIENVWGDLLELGEQAIVSLRTPPVGKVEIRDSKMTIPVTDIVDWQVMFPDGTLRGGFTQRATFRILERDRGRLPRKYAAELARYREVV